MHRIEYALLDAYAKTPLRRVKYAWDIPQPLSVVPTVLDKPFVSSEPNSPIIRKSATD